MQPMVRTMRIIWAAELAAPIIFFGVLLQLRSTGGVPGGGQPILLPALGAMALLLAVASFVLPSKLRIAATQNSKPKIAEEVVKDDAQLFRQAPRTQRVFAEPQAARVLAARLWMTPLILGVALLEAVAIFGLVLGFLGFGLLEVLPFFAVAWVLMALRFPTERQMLASLEKVHDAVLPAERGPR